MSKTANDLFADLGIASTEPKAASASGTSLFGDPEVVSAPPVVRPAASRAQYSWPPVVQDATAATAEAATDDPLSSGLAAAKPAPAPAPAPAAAAARAVAAALASKAPFASFAAPLAAAAVHIPSSVSTRPPPLSSLSSAEVAPPSWTLPCHSPLLLGEALKDAPAPAQRLSTALHAAGERAGTLFLTNFRLLWESFADVTPGSHDAADGDNHAEETQQAVSVALNSIERLRRLTYKGGSSQPPLGGDGSVVIECCTKYNARPSLRMLLAESDYARLHAVLRKQIGVPTQPADARANLPATFAMVSGALHCAQRGGLPAPGWSAFDPEREFHRQGLNNPNSNWRVTRLNESFELCGTYPKLLVVPRSIDDADLKLAASFRSGRRFPVLSWKDPYGLSSICRCSQPLVGVAKHRSKQDEELLQAICDTNPFVERLQIIDARPRMNAEVNAAKGKGYEHQTQYPNTKLTFAGIENIHVMRASLRSLLAILQPRAYSTSKEDDAFLVDLDKSGWMDHVRKVLRTAAQVVHMISVERSSVLVHCSDGWDRTSQITALAQLMLDPNFRTIDGFQRLVVKEWLAFGHQFALRSGTPAPLEAQRFHHAPSEEEMSPVFLQFVDCVWQLTQQMPRAFEFNGTYLAHMLHHVTSCEHGTFLCNDERQREQYGLSAKTTSAWDALKGPQYRNPDFAPSADILMPNLSMSAMRPWTAYYCRGAERQLAEPQTLLEARLAAVQQKNEELQRLLDEARRGLVPATPGPQEAPTWGTPADEVEPVGAVPSPAASASPSPSGAAATPASADGASVTDVANGANSSNGADAAAAEEAQAAAAAAAAAAMAAAAAAAAAAASEPLVEEDADDEVFENVRASFGVITMRESHAGEPESRESASPEP